MSATSGIVWSVGGEMTDQEVVKALLKRLQRDAIALDLLAPDVDLPPEVQEVLERILKGAGRGGKVRGPMSKEVRKKIARAQKERWKKWRDKAGE